MDSTAAFLKELISLPGLSGYEGPVREAIAAKWRPLADELAVSRLGSLHALRHASIQKAEGNLLLAVHMDCVGLMVNGIQDGFLSVTNIGGLDPRVLVGQPVLVHGRADLPGIIALLSDRLVRENRRDTAPDLDRILVDLGLTEDEVRKQISIGDLVSFATPPVEMEGDILAGHSLDNRISIAAVTLCLEQLRQVNLRWNVWVSATVQEEVTLAGAYTSAFDLQPDLAIAIDATFAKAPGVADYRAFTMGKGVTIGTGGNIHPGLAKQLRKAAENNNVPFAIEILAESSSTDAIALQVTEGGIPSAVLGIPLRYMHTPAEEVAMADIRHTARLLTGFISGLDAATLPALQKEMLA